MAREESLKSFPAQKHPRGLVTTTLGLHLPLDAETVLNGAVRVRCVAVLSPVLWSSDNEKVLPRQDKREALLLGNKLHLFIFYTNVSKIKNV
ncbi:Carcinoembryonic antigen-related cell adhesion molecule 6 [Aphis craccivora]|uniref:Carcinoembryonic antigen-related cell adhesion molecule 6 n=1 Tax=Aphis craccivora TaxID=307492 RepID=A0A6G0ZDM1_APHCR|nr:Carcinoembryonic antigen-related cell adhesion molecule 6 [Aphis craccivora]